MDMFATPSGMMQPEQTATGRASLLHFVAGGEVLDDVVDSHFIARVERGHFMPGVSANPGGRRGREADYDDRVTMLARRHTKAAIRTLAQIMYNPKESTRERRAAAEALLNRGWGVPGPAAIPAEPPPLMDGVPVRALRLEGPDKDL